MYQKSRNYLIVLLCILAMCACDSNDYRDVYVGDYTGGLSGTIIVEGTEASKEISGSGIHVSKNKSSVDFLVIKIDGDNEYSAQVLDNGGLVITNAHFPEITENDYTYNVAANATGTITSSSIHLQFQYFGTATYTDPDTQETTDFNIGGSSECNGIR